jgi:hypothetical protein
MSEMTEAEELLEIQRGFAADHVRKGFYDEDDLELLGITQDEAEAYQRKRDADRVAGYLRSLTPAQRDEFMERVTHALEEQDGQHHD